MMSQKRIEVIQFLMVFFFALALFLLFHSIQWDINGIIEAQAIKSPGLSLLSPNHMLFQLIGFIVFSIVRLLGFTGLSAGILQNLTAILAAFGIALFWKFLKSLTGNIGLAFLITALLCVSWGYWVFSIDIYYITPTTSIIIGILLVLNSESKKYSLQILLLGFLSSLAILFWEANIFLIPIIILALIIKRRDENHYSNWKRIGGYLITTFGVTATTFLIVAILIRHLSTLSSIFEWLFSHGNGQNVALWGKLSLDRVPSAITSSLASFIPVWEGLGLKEVLQGHIDGTKLLAQLSLLALIGLFLISFYWLVRRRKTLIQEYPRMIWLLLAYLVYIPFIIWWDPYEPKWWVIPNIFLVTIFALILNFSNQKRIFLYFEWGMVAIIALANFNYTIWPRHITPNNQIALAQCFSEHVNKNDTVVVLDWSWFNYADYFYQYKGKELNFVDNSLTKDEKLKLIMDDLPIMAKQNGRILIRDAGKATPSEQNLIYVLTGFRPKDFTIFNLQHAFDCLNTSFMVVTGFHN